jgi:hypothetical protein
MTPTTTATTTSTPPAAKPGRKGSRGLMNIKLDKTTSDARRHAAAVLEVLAGVRTPTDAAKALTLSLPAYYKLESRALRGLVVGCGPAPRGPTPSPEVEAARLRRQCHRLQQDVQRYQALARAAQRAAGLPTVPVAPTTDPKGRHKRKPTVRALKAVTSIRSVVPQEPPTVAAPAPLVISTVP